MSIFESLQFANGDFRGAVWEILKVVALFGVIGLAVFSLGFVAGHNFGVA